MSEAAKWRQRLLGIFVIECGASEVQATEHGLVLPSEVSPAEAEQVEVATDGPLLSLTLLTYDREGNRTDCQVFGPEEAANHNPGGESEAI